MSELKNKVQQAIKEKTQKGGEWNKLLEQDANTLYELIKIEIIKYYGSYTPKKYNRTYDMLNSLRIKVSGDGFHIYFEPNLSYHPTAFVPTLMDAGWYYSAAVHRFTYWEGDAFIERAIANYRKRSDLPVKITIESKYYPEYYRTLG